MSEAVDRVLALLQGVVPERGGWRALCPAHEDHDPSLRISEGKDGQALLTCRSHNCAVEQITAALGIKVSDLFEQQNGHGKPTTPTPKRFGKVIAQHDYTDEKGITLFRVERDELKNFRQRKPSNLEPPADAWIPNIEGVRRVPYRLPEVLAACALKAAVRIHIVEGEKDADRLVKLGLVATTNMGGAGKWTEDLSRYLDGAKDVAILADNDPPGKEHAEKIAAQLRGKVGQLRVVTLPGLPPKGDVSDYLDQGHAGADLAREIDQAALIKDPSLALIEISRTLDEFLAIDFKKPRSLLGENVLSAGDLAFLYGRPGIGKTWLILQMILTMARMESTWGLAPPEGDPIRIGILELELHGYWLKQRLLGLAGEYGVSDISKRVKLVSRPDLKGAVDVLDDAQWSAWIRWTRDEGLDLVIIDALSRAHQTDENKAVEFGPVLGRFDDLRFETGAAVLPIHHEPKVDRSKEVDDMDVLRGSSRMATDANTLMRFVRAGHGGGFLNLRFPKCNNAPEPEPIWLIRSKSGRLEVTEPPEQIREKNRDKIEELLEESGDDGIEREAIEKATGLKRSAVLGHLKALKAKKSGTRYCPASSVSKQTILDGAT